MAGRQASVSAVISVLTVMQYIAAAVLVITVGLALAGADVAVQFGPKGPNVDSGPGASMTIPVSFTVDARTHAVAAPSIGVERAEIIDAVGALKFPLRRGAFLVVNLLVLIVTVAIGVWVLGQLRALFRAVRDGHPFVPANATRMRRIGWVVIVGELARTTLVFFENAYAVSYFSGAGLQFDAWPHLNGFAIINGLIILAIAEVFRAGTRLDEEQSLTV